MNEQRLTKYDEAAKASGTKRTERMMDSEALQIKDNKEKERARSQRILEMSRKRSWLLTNPDGQSQAMPLVDDRPHARVYPPRGLMTRPVGQSDGLLGHLVHVLGRAEIEQRVSRAEPNISGAEQHGADQPGHPARAVKGESDQKGAGNRADQTIAVADVVLVEIKVHSECSSG